MKATFHTAEFAFNNGLGQPRGRGRWMFQVTCTSPEQQALMLNPQQHGLVRAERAPHDTDDLVLTVAHSVTYTEAKARVRLFLRSHFAGQVDVTVCP